MARAKLRKMLGSVEDSEVIALMRAIEGQSKQTLAAWAVCCARERYLPILVARGADDGRLIDALAAAGAWAAGETTLKDLRAALRPAQAAAREATSDPTAQAAARAIATACGVGATPTNALGFTFYGAAAVAYEAAGLEAGADVFDGLAREEFRTLLAELREVSVEDEPNPARIDWNC